MDPALAALGEFGLIDLIRRRAVSRSAGALHGIGDDAAVLSLGPGAVLATVDLLLEGVHFERGWGRPRELGRKTLAVNLSDIAAMGGEPLFALLGLGLPANEVALAEIEAFLAGLEEEAAAAGVTLVGGDTCRSRSGLVLSLTLVGRAVPPGPVLRSGARSGESLYVTGRLGGAAAGLLALARGLRPDAGWPGALPRPAWLGEQEEAAVRDAMARHLAPAPRLAAGRALTGLASAMIDVSDGVASDAGHLCRESGVAAVLTADRIPIHPGAQVLARLLGQDPLALALSGGEDYELLFTAAMDPAPALAAAAPGLELSRIGEMVTGAPELRLRDQDGTAVPLRPGFDHFRGGS